MTLKKPVENGRKRLAVYFERVNRALDSGRRDQAMADLSELAFIARRLWEEIAKQNDEPSS